MSKVPKHRALRVSILGIVILVLGRYLVSGYLDLREVFSRPCSMGKSKAARLQLGAVCSEWRLSVHWALPKARSLVMTCFLHRHDSILPRK